MIVVANTSPICYLLLIGHIDLLPVLFSHVIIPQAVHDELSHERAPAAVRSWIAKPPDWLEIQSVETTSDVALDRLHPGEREAIALAENLGADLIVLDEKAAREVAANRGLRVTGLLGILDEAATRGLIELSSVIDRLRQTTFRASPRLLKFILDRHQKMK
jgi:predicted nucleic acid-binding protein